MTKDEAIAEINKVFEPAFANYIVTALTEGATVSDSMTNGDMIKAVFPKVTVTNEDRALIHFYVDEDDGHTAFSGCIQKYVWNAPYKVESEDKRGKWITEYEEIKHNWGSEHNPHTRCSVCNKEYLNTEFMNYCPNCGSYNRGDTDEKRNIM